jgi:hypothetical protein
MWEPRDQAIHWNGNSVQKFWRVTVVAMLVWLVLLCDCQTDSIENRLRAHSFNVISSSLDKSKTVTIQRPKYAAGSELRPLTEIRLSESGSDLDDRVPKFKDPEYWSTPEIGLYMVSLGLVTRLCLCYKAHDSVLRAPEYKRSKAHLAQLSVSRS